MSVGYKSKREADLALEMRVMRLQAIMKIIDRMYRGRTDRQIAYEEKCLQIATRGLGKETNER